MGYKVLDHRGNTIASTEIEETRKRRKALSAYRGASAGRTTADWAYSTGSADATLLPERWSLIYRIRERLRNDPVMRGCLKKAVDAIVGPRGFNTHSQLDHVRLGISEQQARDIERDIDYEWKEWQKECDYSGNPARSFSFASLLSLQVSTEWTCGETLTIPRYYKRPWSRFSFSIQLVAPDRICTPHEKLGGYRGLSPASGEDIRDGIKIGKRGDIDGIFVARQHPGSYRFAIDNWKSDYIPAWNRKTRRANFWHNFQIYQTEATRGEPVFAASLMGFKALGDYVTDELTRAHMATMLGLIIKRDEAFDPSVEGIPDADKVGDSAEQAEAQIELYSGMVNYLKPGEEADVVNPNIPGPQFTEFTDKLLTWTAAPTGLSREQAGNSFEKMSFSAAKASRAESQRGFKKLQDDVIESYIEPPRKLVIEEAWMRGRLDLPGFDDPALRQLYFDHVTYPSPWTDLEPVKEETASKLRLSNGTSSLIRECSMRGYSLNSILDERQKEKLEHERRGLPLPAYLREEPVEIDTKPTDENEDDDSDESKGKNDDND